MALRDYLVGEVAEDFADGHISRREALRCLGLLGLGLTSATTLLAACSGDDDGDGRASRGDGGSERTTTSGDGNGPPDATTAPQGAVEGATSTAEPITFAAGTSELQGVWASPEQPKGAVLVVHENRGLTPHFSDLVTRLARDGYAALAVDLLSPQGGTAALPDEGAVQAALAETPMDVLVVQLQNGIDELQRRAPGRPVAVIGFCFGGAMVWQLLTTNDTRYAVAVPFYGPAPESPDFSGSRAAVLAIYAGNDDRVNATRDRAVAALEQAALTFEVETYEGVDHAFFNDTGPRYDEQAATEAYARMLAWFDQHLT
jgi:carboxymethylenebutenolidase